ncbi:hypothetical protein AUC68_02305 [Methyloceanibacter methanicus]|uniref:Uncharacterized protein n=1 Tax=Methyloceanibacter methanicus TaxID=1774968 RepID=A0A1E3W2F8_9HYPH|nr:hypothetical protein [Methyloceanibacter methanicus]ODR99960.1 hypothetical protein AUC68_02305 [Methyloceanibacter methanicus]
MAVLEALAGGLETLFEMFDAAFGGVVESAANFHGLRALWRELDFDFRLGPRGDALIQLRLVAAPLEAWSNPFMT